MSEVCFNLRLPLYGNYAPDCRDVTRDEKATFPYSHRVAMDVDQVADDKKPLASLEETTNDDDLQPDPDETLQLDSGGGKIWLVKVYLTTMQL